MPTSAHNRLRVPSYLKNCSKLSIPANYQIKHWPPATRSWKHYKYYDKPERNFPSVSPQIALRQFCLLTPTFQQFNLSFGTSPFDAICPSSQFQSVCSVVHAPLQSASESLASEKKRKLCRFLFPWNVNSFCCFLLYKSQNDDGSICFPSKAQNVDILISHKGNTRLLGGRMSVKSLDGRSLSSGVHRTYRCSADYLLFLMFADSSPASLWIHWRKKLFSTSA